MVVFCRHKIEHGRKSCATHCPASVPGGVFRYARVESPSDVPATDERTIDVAVLDMNHGWPNLGHDSLVHSIQDAACDLREIHAETGLSVRVISFDVRRSLVVPEPPPGRFALYVGSGGPGHLDPRLNDGVGEGTQGIREDPSWEQPLFGLFDAIRADPDAALIAICHSFGLLCRWRGIARPVLRGPEKDGKSSGVLENVLTREARQHPWFGRFAAALPEERRLRILDNRLYDMVAMDGVPPDVLVLAYETLGIGGPAGDALTMFELERDRGGVMPRVFGVNHHPEIVDRVRQHVVMQRKLQRGEVTQQWIDEREEILTRTYPDEDSEERLHLTSEATLLAPARFFLHRAVRQRAEALGLSIDLSEERVLETTGPAAVAAVHLEDGSA